MTAQVTRLELLAKRAAEVVAEAGGLTTPVPSPCVSVCVMHAKTGLCEGCFRRLDEIGIWSQLPDQAKRQVWQRIALRINQVAQN